MPVNLVSQLREQYPAAFPTQDLAGITLSCGIGWYPIIESLCSLLCDLNRRVGQAPIHIHSVREKLGTARLSVSGRVAEVEAWITFAERHSTRTCELCGGPGRLLYEAGWQRVRCDTHRNETCVAEEMF